MAIHKGKIRQRNSGGTYDYLLPETSIDMVNGLQDELDSIDQQLVSKADQRKVDVLSLGVKGDSSTDDFLALRNIISTLNHGDTLYFPNATGYRITDTLTIPEGINVDFHAPLIGDFVGKPVLVVGNPNERNSRVTLNLHVEYANLTGWENSEERCITLYNNYECNINIIRSRRGKIGARLIGSGAGFTYNKLFLGQFYDNQTHIECTNALGGWCNENIFYGGRFSNTQSTYQNKSRYGVIITTQDGIYVNNNNNVFIKPSMELQADSTAPEVLPFLIVHGEKNHVFEARNESNGIVFARCENDSNANTFTSGYGSCNVVSIGRHADNFGVAGQYVVEKQVAQKVFDSGNLTKKANYYNGANSVYIPGMHISSSVNANILKSASLITMHNDYIEVPSSRAIGVVVDTNVQKEFIVRRDLKSSSTGRVMIRCYDENGIILNESDSRIPHVRSTKYTVFGFFNSFGGVYRNGSDVSRDIYVQVAEHVKKIDILLGSTTMQLKSFQIESLNGHATVWSGIEGVDSFSNYATSVPTVGVHQVGETLINDVPNELGSVGSKYIIDKWKCTTAGIPGVWMEFRTLTGN